MTGFLKWLFDLLASGMTDKGLDRAGASKDALRVRVAKEFSWTGYSSESGEIEARCKIVGFMEDNVGDRYTFGAEIDPKDPNPETGDCSEYTEQAHVRAGMNYPDGVVNQRAFCRGRRVAKPKPGDPFFFKPNKRGVPHTGIYVGDGMVVHASGSRGAVVRVPVSEIESHPDFEYWARHPDFSWPQEERA